MKDSNIIIHIGYHKTGSTFLQRRIFPQLSFNQLMQPQVGYLAKSQPYNPYKFVKQLEQKHKLNQSQGTIISQETLSGQGDGNPMWDAHLIAERLHETFPNAKILIVIRNQLDYILSFYTFRVVKRGLERHPLPQYLEDKFDWLHTKLQYDLLVRHYLNLFGQNQVRILLYEDLVQDANVFIQDILNFINIQTEIEWTNQRENQGTRNRQLISAHRLLNYPLSATMDALRHQGILTQKQYSRLADRCDYFKRLITRPVLAQLYQTKTTQFDFDPAWKLRLQAAFRESNHQLATLIDTNLADYGYPW